MSSRRQDSALRKPAPIAVHTFYTVAGGFYHFLLRHMRQHKSKNTSTQ